MLRGLAALRRVTPMDPEHGLGASLGPNRRNSAQRRLDSGAQLSAQTTTAVSSFGRAILSFFLVLLVLGVLPATFVFWACIIVIVFTVLRLRLQAQNLHETLEQDDVGALGATRPGVGGSRGPVVRVLPGGGLLLLHTDPQAALEQLNLQLRHLDEEMGFTGYDYESPYTHTARGTGIATGAAFGPRPPPVSEADIAALPCYPYKPPRSAGSPAGRSGPSANEFGPQASAPAAAADGSDGSGRVCMLSSSSPTAAATQQAASSVPGTGSGAGQQALGHGGFVGNCSGVTSSSASSSPSSLSSSSAGGSSGVISGSDGGGGASAHVDSLTCPVCLDAVAEGSTVMTLPCLHQFHAACVTPWLRQQGIYASCPMCKTPVFQ